MGIAPLNAYGIGPTILNSLVYFFIITYVIVHHGVALVVNNFKAAVVKAIAIQLNFTGTKAQAIEHIVSLKYPDPALECMINLQSQLVAFVQQHLRLHLVPNQYQTSKIYPLRCGSMDKALPLG